MARRKQSTTWLPELFSDERFVVRTASYKLRGSSWGYRVAVIETNGTKPSQINPRHKSVVRIVKMWDGFPCRNEAFSAAWAKAIAFARLLNDPLVHMALIETGSHKDMGLNLTGDKNDYQTETAEV